VTTPGHRTLVVDDASPDSTGQLAEAMASGDPHRHVLHRGAKAGLGSAYRTGFRWCLERGYDRFVAMDADLSHDPASLPALLTTSARADLVIGSRYVPGGRVERWPLRRRLLSAGGNPKLSRAVVAEALWRTAAWAAREGRDQPATHRASVRADAAGPRAPGG
jgi:dolichol-phosphate mannosyltransferase